MFFVQQRDISVRKKLGGRQYEQFMPTLPEQFKLDNQINKNPFKHRAEGIYLINSLIENNIIYNYTWSTKGRVISAGKLLIVETVTKIEAAVS